MKDWLTIVCVSVMLFGSIGGLWFYQYPHSTVYACSDKESNPPDVQVLCQRLTQGQWWAK
jgi:hypothetical protein